MMDKITEALDKRHTERRTKLENLHDQRIREASVNEGTHYFESMFHEKVREIQKNLTNLELGDDHLIATFSKTSQSLQDLQKFLSSSAFYLNDRKVQKCQDMLNELTNNLEERKTVLIPKKKFGFKNRVADATKKK